MENQTGEKKMTNIEQKINEILRKGTRFVSFKYNDKVRNVLVGDKGAAFQGPWGFQRDRAIRENGARKYLIARPMNDDSAPFKAFALDKIENPSAILT